MNVEFTKDVESRRSNSKFTWEIFSSHSLVQTLHRAKELGWKDKKVQVRAERVAEDVVNYIIEPWEKDCSCPSMLRYSDYFD